MKIAHIQRARQKDEEALMLAIAQRIE